MDKVELGIKLEQIDNLKQKNDYSGAAKVADSIEWRKVKKWSELSVAVDVYEKADRLADSRNVCVYAYNRSLGGRRLLYKLTELSIKLKDYDEADELYHEFVQMAPHDMSRYVLLYQLNTARGASVDRLIEILEEYKQNELDEQYEYELASLYSKAGRIDECIKECDDIILWFAEGEYVLKALKLKETHTELTRSQKSKLEVMDKYGTGESETVFDEVKSDDEIKVPVKDYSIYDTQNVQAALAESMDLILKTIHDTDKKNGVPVETLSDARPVAEITAVTADIDEVDEPTKEIRINTHHWNRVRSEMVGQEDLQSAATREAVAPGSAAQNTNIDEELQDNSEEDDQIEGQMSIMDWLSAAGIETIEDARHISGLDKEEVVTEEGHEDITEESVFSPAAVDAPVAPPPVEPIPSPSIPGPVKPEPTEPEIKPEIPQTVPAEPEIPAQEIPEQEDKDYEIPSIETPEPVIPQPEIPLPDITTVPDTPYMETEPVEEELKSDDPEDELEKLITDQIEAITKEMESEAAVSTEEVSETNETESKDSEEEETESEEPEAEESEVEETESETTESTDSQPEDTESAEQADDSNEAESSEDESEDEISFEDDSEESDEDDEIEDKYKVDNSYHMQNDEKKYLAKYLFMKGMEDKLSELIGGKKKEAKADTSSTGNIVITGKRNTDKTSFAINIFKALHAFDEVREQKVAKTKADNLNKSNLESTFNKVKGTTLIVENAGSLSKETAVAFSEFMAGDTNGMLVIFVDEEYEINKLFSENKELADMFPYRLNLKHYSVNELVEMAKEYAKNKGYSIEDKALLKLYLLIDELKGDDSGSELASVKEIINQAITKSESRSFSLFKKKVRGLTLLKEKDFETK